MSRCFLTTMLCLATIMSFGHFGSPDCQVLFGFALMVGGERTGFKDRNWKYQK
jgi:hypothetical protein